MWKPGQLVTIKNKVYRVRRVKSPWYGAAGDKPKDHPCYNCSLHHKPECLLFRPSRQTCIQKLGYTGYLKKLIKKRRKNDNK